MIPGRLTAGAIAALRNQSGRLARPLADVADAIGDQLREKVPAPPNDGPERDNTQGSTGFIIVRLGERSGQEPNRDYDRLEDFAKAADLTDLVEVMARYDLSGSRPLIRSVSRQRLREMEAKARQSDLPPLRSLSDYWKLDARGQLDRIDEALKVLRQVPGVAAAYLEAQYTEAAVNAANDTYNGQQGYLDAAPDGIDARWAWTQPNGCGAGIAVIDVERGWTLTHEDFSSKSPALIFGDNRPGSADHGTAVLGEMIADDNTVGVVGIATLGGPVSCASYWDSVTGTSSDLADAVVAAIATLNAGDVLIIEAQTVSPNPFGAPAEYVDESFDAIRLASALGIIVFEAAGNGSNDLDTLTNGGAQIFNPASPDFRESGAIICGAANSALPHDRANFSTFGARVDCYAWGGNVVTCGYGTLDDGGGDVNQEYADTFNGTSSATPIVAGAGMIIQGMQAANTGVRLSPQQMRLLLSNPATGTAQGPNVAGNIGVMPDLRAIIEDTLGLSPDVYLRDNVGDDGSVPTSGGISASPDIIVRPVAIANPGSAFGEGSGVENSTNLGFQAEAGQDNFLYVRMKNRGGADAVNVTARVFWSEVSTLVTPDMWNEIGTTAPVNVPQGDTLVVTPELTWPAAEIPGTGHYCFVGILNHAQDPAPAIPVETDWDGFRSFIRNQNNVTWRNFNVVDNIADPTADPFVGPFLIANLRDRRRFFDFVIEQRLAGGLQAALELPLELVKAFCGELRLDCQIDRERKVGIISLPRAQRLFVPRVLLPAGARLKCRFIVKGLGERGRPGNEVSIAQQFEQQEMGRVTWRFVKKRNPEEVC
ncbi:MAG: S8 family serine peptidase [Leptolyngbya sp. SIO4C1]|nr:S8 family serine peptidase [Leptolyngbya sp. SIO4C1]